MRDVIVIGGGPAGSTAATLLARRGFSVLLLERERFPRFQIGESLLPYNNELLERLGVKDQLSSGDFFPKYGAEFVTGDGRVGYTFRFDRNLPEQYHSAYQVKRSEFDHLLLRNAAASGVEVREETLVSAVDVTDSQRATVMAAGERLDARFVIDASGHSTVMGNRLGDKSNVESLKKVAVFAHYRNVERAPDRDAGNTVIVILRDSWFWLIPISREITSVGLVVDRDHMKRCGLSPEQLLEQTIAATAVVRKRMTGAQRVSEIYSRKDFSYAMKRVTGENFAMIGDAAGFLDPIFSTGVFMAMKSADIVASAVEEKLRHGRSGALRDYERSFQKALHRYFRFIENFYRREFLEVFMQPRPGSSLILPIVGVLAGNVFAAADRWRLNMFFALVRLQRFFRIARPIQWDRLPRAASM